MVKLARERVEKGEIGEIVNVNAEYLQDWLIDEIGGGSQTTTKLGPVWRTDPGKLRYLKPCGRYWHPH